MTSYQRYVLVGKSAVPSRHYVNRKQSRTQLSLHADQYSVQYNSTIIQYNNIVLQYHTYPERSSYLMYLGRYFTLLTLGQGEQMFFCSSELSLSHQANLVRESPSTLYNKSTFKLSS